MLLTSITINIEKLKVCMHKCVSLLDPISIYIELSQIHS